MSRDRLDLVCTDRGQHAPAQLAVVEWWGTSGDDPLGVWTPGEGVALQVPAETTRATRKGGRRHLVRTPTEQTTRADGGVTFHLPACPRCGRRVRVRDDQLELLRDLPRQALDVSLRGM